MAFSVPSVCLWVCLLTGWPLSGVRAQAFSKAEVARWQQQAKQVTITRDTWGVPHIYGKTDADVVFGLLFTQCEDDFDRVEENYITSIGRLAEVEGESALYQDLRARLFLDSTQAIAIYKKSPLWMKKLLDAFADGTNYYLYTHPNVTPKLLRRFQPWMPLMFSEGSIGGNISVVPTERLKAFYEQRPSTSSTTPVDHYERESIGSNGFAIAPAKSATKNALLLINPHTSFYFRSEVHMVSQAGLNAYGAVTWGQFFVYQGFNEHCGWMHTTSYADSMDEYLETIEKKGNSLYYKQGTELKPVRSQKVRLPYKTASGTQFKEFTMYFTQHGPIAGEQGGKWIAIDMMNTPLNALSQSYLRTKATGYASFREVMKLNGNASNNTIFADRDGTIAYWHGNFMPRRDPRFDWSQPVDGSNPATNWKGLHSADEIVQVRNPATGWIQNCNATPFTVSGSSSPDKTKYPAYMAPDPENYRGINAVRVLSQRSVFTLDTLIAAANDPHLAAFDELLPALLSAWKTVSADSANRSKDLAEAIQVLQRWDKSYGASSIGQTLAIHWGEKIQRLARSRAAGDQRFDNLGLTAFTILTTSPQEKVTALASVLTDLTRDFGTWKTPWGDINRYQRLTGKIQETYDDQKPSIPVGFTSSAWGSLAAFAAKTYPGTKKRYGSVGNSFVAVVEFGKRVTARSVVTGGQSSRPGMKHFTDQAPLYCEGNFKDVLFYPEDVQKHVEKTYHPGE
ncbi:penicillin acylase family protein [Spirosoma utsteinense]|uniref:Acyl-homoserine lactone acylase PvdQ n=1 Tax=Spirosoma utsteinense TaxID=2585773 RepID=A0ABR6WEH6_9BACT|nr:penicillin acylase family protein [Spirosoma utsteinense]MBC3785673.1 acyl-homoserine lactone acylase PvdQ [Spirosoma utsteinense]MBC3794593.1 acyl-homoserine lactone acylase PvdQ [Spirosoma utsteinense]